MAWSCSPSPLERGMLTARITTLVLATYCFGNYIFLLLFLHWIFMTAWIIYQKTDFCENLWEERIYNAVVGVIYIFCFFNLLEGQSRWRLLCFYLIIVFQNLSCLKLFLGWFATSNPKLAFFSFIAIVGGMLVGTLSMVLYYKFFHPSAPIKFFFKKNYPIEEKIPAYSSLTLRSLKRMRSDSPKNQPPKINSQTESLKNFNTQTSLSDSVVIVEENSFENHTDSDIRTLKNWIIEETDNTKETNFSEDVNVVPAENYNTEGDLYKRRAICSSVGLEKLLESKMLKTDSSERLNLELDEAPSEILSAHDYENLCAVNIARETWGLRSWKGYTDIETWLHDDSVINDRKLDTLTTTTTSSDILLRDGEILMQDDCTEGSIPSDAETTFDEILPHFPIDTFPIYPLGTLPPILEIDETSIVTKFSPDIKIREGSLSTLVATIDEIRRNTPIQNRLRTVERIYDVSPVGSIKVSPIQKWSKIKRTSRLLLFPQHNVKLQREIDKDKNIIFQTNDEVSQRKNEKDCDLEKPKENSNRQVSAKEKENSKEINYTKRKGNDCNNKENIPTVASKISHWNKILNSEGTKKSFEKIKFSPAKMVNVKEKRNLFLKKVFSPSRSPPLQKNKEIN